MPDSTATTSEGQIADNIVGFARALRAAGIRSAGAVIVRQRAGPDRDRQPPGMSSPPCSRCRDAA